MSGQRFLETLRQLGYPKTDELDAESFDWMFENDDILPFLEWFSDNIHASNLLHPKELKEYNALQQSSEGVLDGRQLEEAVQSLSSLEEDEASEEKLQDDISRLKEEVAASQNRKDKLVRHRNKLSLHHTSVSHRLSKMGKVEGAAKQNYKKSLEQSHADNAKINSSLEKLTGCVSELSSLYHRAAADPEAGQGQENAAFLSQLPLEDYHKMEEKFTQELTSFTKKQFFEGIAEMAGQHEGSRYEFLEVSNPENLLIKGENEDVNFNDCKELARLQAIFPKSESQFINAVLEEQSTNAACELAEKKAHTIRDSHLSSNVQELSAKLVESESSLTRLKKEVARLAEEEIPSMIKDSASLQVTKILLGDYNLKIARQDYFTSNQEEVIKELVRQRARNEFLTMSYEIESRNHRDTHRLLTAVNMQLQKNLTGLQHRMKMMEDPGLNPARHQRGTVDSRDKFIMRLHQIMVDDPGDKQQLFLTYPTLANAAEQIQHQVAALRTSQSSTNSSQDSRLALLEKNLKACESMVYSGSTTTAGQPVLSPQPVIDAITQLDAMLKKLEETTLKVIRDIDHKKKTLKGDPLQAKERDLYLYFFNEPDRLLQTVDNISARLQAQLVT